MFSPLTTWARVVHTAQSWEHADFAQGRVEHVRRLAALITILSCIMPSRSWPQYIIRGRQQNFAKAIAIGIVAIHELTVLYKDAAGQLHNVPVTWDEVKELEI